MHIDRDRLQDAQYREEVLDALVRAHHQEVVHFCVGRLGAEGEEVAQDVFAAAWEALPQFTLHPEATIANWLFGIARNQCRHALRTRANRTRLAAQWQAEIERHVHLEPEATPEEMLADRAQAQHARVRLTATLKRLKREDQLCVIWRYMKELSVEAIADLLNTTPAAARKRLTRAVHRLQELMNDESLP